MNNKCHLGIKLLLSHHVIILLPQRQVGPHMTLNRELSGNSEKRM